MTCAFSHNDFWSLFFFFFLAFSIPNFKFDNCCHTGHPFLVLSAKILCKLFFRYYRNGIHSYGYCYHNLCTTGSLTKLNSSSSHTVLFQVGDFPSKPLSLDLPLMRVYSETCTVLYVVQLGGEELTGQSSITQIKTNLIITMLCVKLAFINGSCPQPFKVSDVVCAYL